jgi:hypothetical protein
MEEKRRKIGNTIFDSTNRGQKVELIFTDDADTSLKPGDKGTYKMAIINPDMIQHRIEWDNGSTLLLIGGKDSFKFVGQKKESHR